ncbi:sigma-70 family RNA polymerase sigma factor [Pararhizobium antarcticum]|uniref:RNA polymerase subunit sigma n=1 Tax=Pararhizobium antarcticum TaxID=1798805 RepID=A0A657LKF0_9HYPH|nr:sigma-70 family RNA polymerase sigma factor [Pararhizobium antarcticum]OJF90478.1 RNA polymerase subunit sigma [Pararhizobium antarcticum]OJF98554.1 RNA polymerase subunit sigma [Rhizobium sp. 58]
MTIDDISTLIGRVSLRDRAAFSELYKNTSPKLFAICIRILRDRNEAEEALQEIYIKVWQRSDRYATGETSPMAWLSAIARNHAIDMIRARKPVANTIDEAYDLADSSPDPEKSALNSAEGRRIDTCMQQLDSDRADAVRKAYVEGLSYQELAELFNVPLNTMRTWLRRSLLKLRECMDQ